MRQPVAYAAIGGSLLLAGAVVASAGAADPGAASAPCARPADTKLIASDGGSKAWRVTIDGGFGAPDLRRFVACERGRAPFVFERGDTGASTLTEVPAADIRGRHLAYGRIRNVGLGTARATLVVRDLRTHRATYVRRAVSKELELESFDDVEVRASGSVAWIASNVVGDEGAVVYEVRKRERGGSVLLDSGMDVAPRSLKLTPDGRVRWIRAGAERFAPLP